MILWHSETFISKPGAAGVIIFQHSLDVFGAHSLVRTMSSIAHSDPAPALQLVNVKTHTVSGLSPAETEDFFVSLTVLPDGLPEDSYTDHQSLYFIFYYQMPANANISTWANSTEKWQSPLNPSLRPYLRALRPCL
uniref:Uncharacterized protein n=2 Tax=Cacopsylla melanoneura TaxID=428564 RepID=A0A8D9F7L6_9HEMI